LGCGRYKERKGGMAGDFDVIKYSDFKNKIIPFFLEYPILGIKSRDFADFSKVVELMGKKAHLTQEGLDKIREIKSGMNTGRKF
jgi:hypothetical protein